MSQTSKYEILYIIRPNIDEAAKAELVARFESKDWAKRRFAYEIKDFQEGIYHLVNITAEDAAAIDEFDRLAKINNDILRHMIVKLEA